jgi:Ca2+-binding EF-hand superfamily protein
MQTKVIVVSVVAVGATALGGMILFGGEQGDEAQSGLDGIQVAENSQSDSYQGFNDLGEAPEAQRRMPESAGRGGSAGTGDRFDFAARMARFDADGDGILSDEERKAMREAMRDEWRAKMDLDGDGEISREERMAARQARFENSERGQALMRRFDLDGDGVLNADEQAALDEYNQEQRQARRDEQLAQYDADGDGEISREERQVQREDQRAQWDQLKDEAVIEFDLDGDGVLNIEEQQDAINAYLARREIDRFVSQYDRDGDGQMGSGDYESFVSDYGAGNPSADVNNDGVVNSLDLAAYRDMVAQSNNRP